MDFSEQELMDLIKQSGGAHKVGHDAFTGKPEIYLVLGGQNPKQKLNAAVDRYFDGRTTFMEMDSEGWV